MNIEETLNGVDLFGEPIKPPSRGIVSDKFGFPPFSILDARQGEWQDRKRAWTALGMKSEIGRNAPSIHCPTGSNQEGLEDAEFTSIFDPTLCECMYRWFSRCGDHVTDPFAGGSVRGIVAGMLEREYWGCDLRKEQIEANRSQSKEIDPNITPKWVCGDSLETLSDSPSSDFVFSCPPYGDLEKYSEEPGDLSNMEWHTFKAAYGRIILKSIQRLKNDRFACFVVGDFRDKRGFYRDFVSTTIAAFRSAGAELYNEAILVTAVGSASMRVTKQFESGRKFAKTHQNVLVFCKGDWKKAARRLNP